MAVTLTSIKELFEEMLQKHEATITEKITANNKIMNDQMNRIFQEVEDVKNRLEENIKSVKERVQKTELCLKKNQDIYIEELKRKMVDREDRSRRKDSERIKVKEMFRQKLKLENIEIDKAHGTGKKT